MNQSLALEANGRPARRNPRLGLERLAILACLAVYLAAVGAAWWRLSGALPDHLALNAFGHVLTIHNLHERVVGNGALLFAILPSALWLECAMVGWSRSSVRQLLLDRTPSSKTDLAVFLLGLTPVTGMLGRLMTFGIAVLSGVWIHDWLKSAFGVAIDPTGLPFAVQVAIYFFAYTFFDYWTHRVDHTEHFWPLHRYHHSAADFCVVNAARTHPASFTYIFLINTPMAILGATPQVLIDVNVMTIALGFLIHSRIDSDFGWIGRWLVQSPVHHRRHHILDMSEPTGHFGMSPVWDRLFGTWRGDADQSLVIGVDTAYRHGFWVAPDLLRDYLDFWKGLAPRRLKAGPAVG